MSGAVHQPGVCNIETWDGRAWRGGMNRLTETEAITVARKWSTETGRRYRVFDLEGRVIFDSEQTGALATLRDLKVKHEGGHPLPPIGPVIDAVAELVEAAEWAECECSLAERASGHRVECWMPGLRAALARCGGGA